MAALQETKIVSVCRAAIYGRRVRFNAAGTHARRLAASRCHGLPARGARLPSVSGWSAGRPAALRSPSLRSIRAAPDGSPLLAVTACLLATPGFPPSRAGLRAALRPCARPRSGPSGLLPTARRFSLSRLACSRRPASLRLGLVCGPPCGPVLALAPVHPGCSRRLAASWCHASRPPRRATAHRSAKNTSRLWRDCFFVCAARCCPAPGRSALLLTSPCRRPQKVPGR